MAKKKLPDEVLEYFRKEGAKGGKIGGSAGGKKAAAAMTPKQRTERARKAGAARKASGHEISIVKDGKEYKGRYSVTTGKFPIVRVSCNSGSKATQLGNGSSAEGLARILLRELVGR